MLNNVYTNKMYILNIECCISKNAIHTHKMFIEKNQKYNVYNIQKHLTNGNFVYQLCNTKIIL